MTTIAMAKRTNRSSEGGRSFFDDAESFAELAKTVLAPLANKHQGGSPLRIWVPDCSTGQDAYSIAILLEEVMDGQPDCPFVVFGTDVDEEALAVARTGVYARATAADAPRSRRFFTRSPHSGYAIARAIRDRMVFGRLDPFADPFISKVDLVSCRDLLASPVEAQREQILRVIHQALNPGGYLLLLGQDAGVLTSNLFASASARAPIYQRLGDVARLPFASPSSPPALPAHARMASPRRHAAARVGTPHRSRSSGSGSTALAADNERLRASSEDLAVRVAEWESTNQNLIEENDALQQELRSLATERDALADFVSTIDVALVFLDTALRVQRFTPAAGALLNLRPSDVGRAIDQLVPNVTNVDVAAYARAVLGGQVPSDQDACSKDGREFILRARACRGADREVKSVALTFVDVTALKHSERERVAAQEFAAEELRRMTRLRALSLELVDAGNVQALLGEVLRAALDITQANMGTVRTAGEDGALTIAAQVGFARGYLEQVARASVGSDSVCGRAASEGARVVVEDVTQDVPLAGSSALAALKAEGVRAVQSTPLFDRRRRLIGMLATHYRSPHVFDEHERRWLDLLATRAATMLERAELERQLLRAKADLEEQVSDRTRSLNQALEAAHAGAWRVDFCTNRVVWEASSRRPLAIPASSPMLLGEALAFVHESDRAGLEQKLAALRAGTATRWDETFRVRYADGRIAWTHVIGEAERNDEGNLVTLRGINLDVTQQKQAKQELEDSREARQTSDDTLQALLAAMSEGVISHDSAGVIRDANPASHAMFGYEPNELLGRSLEELVPEGPRAHHAAHRAEFEKDRHSRVMGVSREVSGRRKDGSVFPVEVTLTYVPLPRPEGRSYAFITDITARKRAESELRASHEALRQRTDQLRRLVADLTRSEQEAREKLAKMVHDDIQQLLFSVKLRLERVAGAQGTATDDRVDKARSEVDLAIAAARSLSVELFPPTLRQDGFGTALSWLGNWMLEKYGLVVDLKFDARADFEAKDKRTFVFECVRELLFNVVKHAKVDHASVDIAPVPGDAVAITVGDEGVGMDSESLLRQPKGWGLVAIRERLTLLGGSLAIESAVGKGARFRIVLPRGEPESAAS